jgi:hypothetical protein
LAFSLTDRSYSLESASAAFGEPYEKRDVTLGVISEDLIEYCREDVEAAARLHRALVTELRRHPIKLDPSRAYSPASIGKAYLRAMGVVPILERQPDFDPLVLGWAMAAYFGGRAECRIRKTLVPVVPVDFLSEYTTVNALMGTWRHVTARRIAVLDAAARVRQLLSRDDLAELFFEPAAWEDLVCLVEIVPDGDVVPVRARYDAASSAFGIGVNPFVSREPAWYTLADLVASKVLCGRTPEVLRAVSLKPVGRQAGLRAVRIRGMVEVDPRKGDFFRQVIELRRTVDRDDAIPIEDRERLSHFLKILGSATGYGIFAEQNPQELPDDVAVDVYADADEPFTVRLSNPEDPGSFFFAPLAACVTGAGRLLLALLEHEVTIVRPGSYAYCDTDAKGIVASQHGGLVAHRGRLHKTAGGA